MPGVPPAGQPAVGRPEGVCGSNRRPASFPSPSGSGPAVNDSAAQGGDAKGSFQSRLGYRFKDRRLLARALTHRSWGAEHNERLEHLGDSLLGFVITETLYARFPAASEGDLTRMRSHLVCREALAARARDLAMLPCLRLGDSITAGGHDAILADAFESVVAAVYLDSDLPTVKRILLTVFERQLARISPHNPKDAKTRLQERLQKRGLPLPDYQVVGRAGKPHAPVFTVSCKVSGLAEAVTASGGSRRDAERRAALGALSKLEGDG